MDQTKDAFAYRCLPLAIANAHGWELLSPCGFEAEWNGGDKVEDVVIRLDNGAAEDHAVPLFGQGVLTFHVDGLFRTPPGYNLWITGPPNAAKDGIAPLSGVIETDWSPYSFTMNWRFTRPGHVIRFEENEAFCFLFPVARQLLEGVKPKIAHIETEPELKRRFESWSASRDRFHIEMTTAPPAAPSATWQKSYYRGMDADGTPGAPDHQAKLRLAEFEGSAAFHRDVPVSCPHAAIRAQPRRSPIPLEKRDWLLSSLEQLRALSPVSAIPERRNLSADEFRDRHYAANWPVLLKGAVADWPAVARWTPDYLKAAVGDRPVQVQGSRRADPDFERHMQAHAETMAFDTFIDRIARPGAGNDTYLTAYNAAANAEALSALHADLGYLDRFLTRTGHMPRGMFWIGPQDAFTPLHHDLTNNLLVQLMGRKCVLLAAPGETPKLYNDHHVYSRIRDLTEPDLISRFPKLEGLRVHRVFLNPGDALFIPLAWWHQVTTLEFSVTLTHTNFRWPNDAYATYPADA